MRFIVILNAGNFEETQQDTLSVFIWGRLFPRDHFNPCQKGLAIVAIIRKQLFCDRCDSLKYIDLAGFYHSERRDRRLRLRGQLSVALRRCSNRCNEKHLRIHCVFPSVIFLFWTVPIIYKKTGSRNDRSTFATTRAIVTIVGNDPTLSTHQYTVHHGGDLPACFQCVFVQTNVLLVQWRI